ncbi:MAG: tetratricopeptide repeat protein [Thermogutta sp.]|nr:tetratricopeptide repeat protein [Thermogutta sp.]
MTERNGNMFRGAIARGTFAAFVLAATFVAVNYSWRGASAEETAPAEAASPSAGQADLDKAIEAKLNASTFSDLGEVIRLCESAIEKGLDEANAEFAKQLLAATRFQRGLLVGETVLRTLPIDNNWPTFRKMAVEDLEKGLAVDPEQPEAWLMLARLNVLPNGDLERAKFAVDQAVDKAGDDRRLLVQALLLRADLTDDNEKKLNDLNRLLELEPDDPRVLRARGAALLALDKAEEALADFDKALAEAPGHIPTLEAKIDALLELKRFDDAMAVADQIEKASPGNAAAWFQRGRITGVRGEFEKALEYLNKAAEMEPRNVAVLMIRAAVLQELGKSEEAMKDVNRALELRPDNPALLRLRAAILAGSGQLSQAVRDLEQVREQGSAEPSIDLQLGLLYSIQKRHGKALEQFDKVLAVEPRNVAALRGRADTLLSLGRHAEAIADYEKALEVDPNDSGVLNNLAWVLATSPDEKIRNGKRALELATKACELTEYKAAHILSTLAAAYAENGDFENARKWSQKAVELGSENEKEALQKELESYKRNEPVRELIQEPLEPPAETPAEPSPESPSEEEKGTEPEAGPKDQPPDIPDAPEAPQDSPTGEQPPDDAPNGQIDAPAPKGEIDAPKGEIDTFHRA